MMSLWAKTVFRQRQGEAKTSLRIAKDAEDKCDDVEGMGVAKGNLSRRSSGGGLLISLHPCHDRQTLSPPRPLTCINASAALSAAQSRITAGTRSFLHFVDERETDQPRAGSL